MNTNEFGKLIEALDDDDMHALDCAQVPHGCGAKAGDDCEPNCPTLIDPKAQ